MTDYSRNRLDEILKEILYKIPDVQHVMISDRDGILISARSRCTNLEEDFAQTISAFTAPIFESATIQGAYMNVGGIRAQLTEYDNKLMILIGIGEEGEKGVLNTFTEKTVSIQNLIKILNEYKQEISYILTEQINLEYSQITKEIKALFYAEIGLKV